MAITVRALQNFIGGDWVESTGTEVRQIVSPVTGETLAEVPECERRGRRESGALGSRSATCQVVPTALFAMAGRAGNPAARTGVRATPGAGEPRRPAR